MKNGKSALEAMLAQYETNNKPKYEKTESSFVFNKNAYFTIYDLPDGVDSMTKEIRLLPNFNGGSPLVEYHGHTAPLEGKNKTFACLQHEKGTACPFCEAREELLSSGDAQDKEFAKKYYPKKLYVAKVIDRAHEDHGVKYWRFNHDFRKEGVFDKIVGISTNLKKNKDLSNPLEGRDLSIFINRNQQKIPVITTLSHQDPTVLSEDKELMDTWLADEGTWESVFPVKSYEYLEIIVRGDTPVWDRENKCFVSKEAQVEGEDNSEKTLDSELTLQVENVKSNVKAADVVLKPVVEEEEDDLPF